MDLKPSTIEQAKFEYFLLSKIFNKGLDKNDQKKKKGLFKRLKNIENAKKPQQNNNIDLKPPHVFNYLKSLSQETKDLIDEIEDANNDIDHGKLLFIGNNKEKFNFSIFRIPLNFLSAIYNKNNAEEKEKEEINEVLMQANDMLEYKNKIIDAFKNVIFLSGHLKTDDAAHGHVLEDVKDFIQKIE